MEISPKLNEKITDFLMFLPNIHDADSQRALIYRAGLDKEIEISLSVGKPPIQFIPLLITTLTNYGKQKDGRYGIEAILEAAKQYIGQEKQQYCEELLQEFRNEIAYKAIQKNKEKIQIVNRNLSDQVEQPRLKSREVKDKKKINKVILYTKEVDKQNRLYQDLLNAIQYSMQRIEDTIGNMGPTFLLCLAFGCGAGFFCGVIASLTFYFRGIDPGDVDKIFFKVLFDTMIIAIIFGTLWSLISSSFYSLFLFLKKNRLTIMWRILNGIFYGMLSGLILGILYVIANKNVNEIFRPIGFGIAGGAIYGIIGGCISKLRNSFIIGKWAWGIYGAVGGIVAGKIGMGFIMSLLNASPIKYENVIVIEQIIWALVGALMGSVSGQDILQNDQTI